MPMPRTTNENEQARLKKLEAARAKQFLQDLKVATTYPECRRVLSEILRWTHVLALSYSYNQDGSHDPGYTALQEGERNVGLRLIAALAQHTPDAYREMLIEQVEGYQGGNSERGRNDDDRGVAGAEDGPGVRVDI